MDRNDDRIPGTEKAVQAQRRAAGGTASPYKETAAALQRYFLYQGGVTDGDILVAMLGDLAELFEDAAAAGTPVRDIVGENPVEFAEEFTAAYGGQRWIDKERTRLIEAIDQAERKEEGQ